MSKVSEHGWFQVQISRDHVALLDQLREFYQVVDGQGRREPSDREVIEVALEALGSKALMDHPEGGAQRIRHPLAGLVEQRREQLEAALQRIRKAPHKRLIWLA